MIRNKEIRDIRPIGRPGSVSFKEHLKPVTDTVNPELAGPAFIKSLKPVWVYGLAITGALAFYLMAPVAIIVGVIVATVYKLNNRGE